MEPGQLFTNLVIAANVDGQISSEELDVLRGYAKQLGLSAEEAIEIIEAVEKGQLRQLSKPKTPKARERFYKALAKVVRSDRKITREEQQLLRRIGNILEIDEDLMKRVIS